MTGKNVCPDRKFHINFGYIKYSHFLLAHTLAILTLTGAAKVCEITLYIDALTAL